MGKNNNFITAYEIYNRIARTHKKKIEEFGPSDFIEWCAEVETEHICDTASLVLYKSVQLGVYDEVEETYSIVNGQVVLPSNILRLLDVYEIQGTTWKRWKGYYQNGAYIYFDDDNIPENCFISYYGVPVDPTTNYPYVIKGHENACYYYCLMKIYEEDNSSVPPRVNQNTYRDWEWNFDVAVRQAQSSMRYKDRNDLLNIQKVITNMAAHPTNVPLFNLDK